MKPASLLEIFFYVLLSTYIFTIIILPLQSYIKATPPGTHYYYAEGYLIDYYQYLSWIKQGGEGKIPLETRYTWETHPPVIIHPFFTLLGFATHPLGIAPHVALMGSRLVGEALLLITFFLLIRSTLTTTLSRCVAVLLFFSVTELWSIVTDKGTSRLVEPIMGQTNFSVLGKFLLSPHHLLALACVMTVLIILQKAPLSTPKLFIVFLMGVLACFLNPSITSMIVISMIISIPFFILQNWRTSLAPILTVISFSIPAGVVLAYHQIVFLHIPPYTLWYTLAQLYNPAATLTQYLQALGPVIILPPFALLKKDYRTMKAVPILFAWAYVPIILFQFRNGIVPMNAQRIFQSYQYIPLALLGAMGLDAFASFLGKFVQPLRYSSLVIALGFFAYAFPAAHLMSQQAFTALSTNFYNIYLPLPAVHAMEYLDTQTPDESVVVSGEYMSNMIPGFTHNRVILGRDDAIPDYNAHKEQVFAFIDGRMQAITMWRIFAQTHRIQYLLLGVDTSGFRGSTLETYPFLKEVFHEGNVSVVKLDPL